MEQLLDKILVATVTKYDDNLILNHEWNLKTVTEKCKHCKLYPLCWSGCIYDRINNIYPCYLTENIVLHSLKLALDDYNKEMKVTNWHFGRNSVVALWNCHIERHNVSNNHCHYWWHFGRKCFWKFSVMVWYDFWFVKLKICSLTWWRRRNCRNDSILGNGMLQRNRFL